MKTTKPGVHQSFFKRHNRLLTFFGALIVFATFVMKEGVREGLRTLVDTLSSAENSYETREQIVRLNLEFRALTKHLDSIGSAKSAEKPNKVEEILSDVDLLQIVSNTVDASVSNLDVLEELLPPPTPGMKTALGQLRSDVDRFHEEGADLATTFAAILTYPNSLDEAEADIMRQRKKSRIEAHSLVSQTDLFLSRAQADGESLISNGDTVGAFVLKEAQERRREEEKRYRQVTRVSYTLYILGWGLGLVGRLYGGGDVVGGE